MFYTKMLSGIIKKNNNKLINININFKITNSCSLFFQTNSFSSLSNVNENNLKSKITDGVGVIIFNSPEKVNVIDKKTLKSFVELFQTFQKDPLVSSIVLKSSKPDCFIAGADINMLKSCKTGKEMEKLASEGQQIMDFIEKSPKPVVSAIMGSCLGGGLELVLSTHHRVAVESKKTQLGLPEVQLGLLPGSGGTQRLPKLVPLTQAMEMMLQGKRVGAEKAKKMGLVDQVVYSLGPGLKHPEENTLDYLETIAIATAKQLSKDKNKRKTKRKLSLSEKILNLSLKVGFLRKLFFKKVKDKILKATNGLYPGPLKIIEILEKTYGSKANYALEAKLFGELGESKESKALIGLFDGMTFCKKNKFGKPEKPVNNLAVLGAGLMGAGIAQVSIDRNIKTILKDVSEASLNRGLNQIESNLGSQVKRRKLTQFESSNHLSNLDTSLTYDNFKNVDMVIEAVFEDINIKHKVIKEVEKEVGEKCIVASNTSALSIGEVASASVRPQNVIGMHYFSPVDKMMLLEIIYHNKTSNDTIASAVDVGLRQNKVIIVVKDSPGFYTTRCLVGLMSEMFQILIEGMDPKTLDSVTKKMGFPVGSVTLLDEVGVDVASHISHYLSSSPIGPALSINKTDNEVFDLMVKKGFLGRKSGKGVFIYDEKKKKQERQVNREFLNILRPFLKSNDQVNNFEELKMRILTRFTNQCLMCLEEGILMSPLEGDIGAVFGLGFPPFLGGPFKFVDLYGADKIVFEMEKLQAKYGNQFQACQILKDLSKTPGKKFHSNDFVSYSKNKESTNTSKL